MTFNETKSLLATLKVAYPNAYKGFTADDAVAAAKLWESQFADTAYSIVSMAIAAFISEDTSGFPPTIGQIKGKIRLITAPPKPSAAELWVQLDDVVSYGGDWHAEFNRLPAELRDFVGKPSQLGVYARMQSRDFDTFVHSEFIKFLDERRRTEAHIEALPPSVRDYRTQLLSDGADAR